MHYNWDQHRQLAQTVASTPTGDLGVGLALMGIALLMLMKDLETELVELAADQDARVDVQQNTLQLNLASSGVIKLGNWICDDVINP